MCQKNVIDEIEIQCKRSIGSYSFRAFTPRQFDTLLQLARLAERAMKHWEDRMTGTNIHPTSAALFREIRAILHPAPKGIVFWKEYGDGCDLGHSNYIASGLTLDEAKRRMGA